MNELQVNYKLIHLKLQNIDINYILNFKSIIL